MRTAKNNWRLKKFYLLMGYAPSKKVYSKTIYPNFISIIKTVVIMQQKETLAFHSHDQQKLRKAKLQMNLDLSQ